MELTINYDTNSSELRLRVNSVSYLNTAENIVYLEIELRRGKLQSKMCRSLSIDRRGRGDTYKLIIDKTCEYRVERRGLRHYKLKVSS